MDENGTKYVSWDVHNEFTKRMDDGLNRHEDRISALERGLQEVSKITVNVERLATQIETLTKEIVRQGEKLENIEQKPAKRWDVVVTGLLSAVVGAIGAALMSGLIK